MEWAIPLQKLELGKVQIGNLKNSDKLMVPLAYFDGTNTFNNLNILLPKLKVQEFNDKTGKLVLSFKDHKLYDTKINALFLGFDAGRIIHSYKHVTIVINDSSVVGSDR